MKISDTMAGYSVKIESIDKITHDVIRIVTTKPFGYKFIPGQATDVSINKEGWEEKKKPFTFTNLPDENHLEFTIGVIFLKEDL